MDIKEKLRRMENELVEFGDVQGLRSRADVKRKDLAVEKDELEAKKTAVTFSLQEVEGAIKGLKVITCRQDGSLFSSWEVQGFITRTSRVIYRRTYTEYILCTLDTRFLQINIMKFL